jgi:hypothetical protein
MVWWCRRPAAITVSANDNPPHSGDHGDMATVLLSRSRQEPWLGGMVGCCGPLRSAGSFGGLTAALLLRDQGWDVDVLAPSPNPLEGRGAGIVIRPTTVRYLVERAGKRIGDIGTAAPQDSVSRPRRIDRPPPTPAATDSHRISSCIEGCSTRLDSSPARPTNRC